MKFPLIISLVTILGCTTTSDSNRTSSVNADTLTPSDNVTLDSLDYNILKYDDSYHYIFPEECQPADLSEEEIVECEVLLNLFIVDYNAKATKRFHEMSKDHPELKFNIEDFTIGLQDYGRQYMTVILHNGTKMVYVNCFCNPSGFDYREKELVVVMDGGNCFFNFKVNLKEKKMFDFIENGVA